MGQLRVKAAAGPTPQGLGEVRQGWIKLCEHRDFGRCLHTAREVLLATQEPLPGPKAAKSPLSFPRLE